MQVEHVYHDVKVLLNFTPRERENIAECKKNLHGLDVETGRVVYASFYESPTSFSFHGSMFRLVNCAAPQICGYNEMFVLHALATSPKMLPELKAQIDNLWNAFEEHRKLLETFRYETKVQDGNTLDRGSSQKG